MRNRKENKKTTFTVTGDAERMDVFLPEGGVHIISDRYLKIFGIRAGETLMKEMVLGPVGDVLAWYDDTVRLRQDELSFASVINIPMFEVSENPTTPRGSLSSQIGDRVRAGLVESALEAIKKDTDQLIQRAKEAVGDGTAWVIHRFHAPFVIDADDANDMGVVAFENIALFVAKT